MGVGCRRGDGNCLLALSAHAWLLWNSHIQRYANARVRIEDFDTLPGHILRAVCDARTVSQSIMSRVDIKLCRSLPNQSRGITRSSRRQIQSDYHLNSRRHGHFTLADIAAKNAPLAQAVSQLARTYGYSSKCLY